MEMWGLCDCWAFSPFITTLLVLPDINNSEYCLQTKYIEYDKRIV